LKEILILAAVTSVASWIISMMEVFRNVREGIQNWADKKPESVFRQKVAYLPSCPFCTSAYVAAFFLMLAPTKLVVEHPGGYLIAWFFVQSLAYVMMTTYHLGRVAVRWGRAVADTQEAWAERIKIGPQESSQQAELEAKPVHHPATIPFPGLASRVGTVPTNGSHK
jgi:hypothetical protein